MLSDVNTPWNCERQFLLVAGRIFLSSVRDQSGAIGIFAEKLVNMPFSFNIRNSVVVVPSAPQIS